MTAHRSWRTAGANWALIEHQMVWMLSIERRHDRWHDQTDSSQRQPSPTPRWPTCNEHPSPAEQLERLRIADGSIMARVIIGNTMAPCAIIGVGAAEILHAQHVR
jgi:hypothetical protein